MGLDTSPRRDNLPIVYRWKGTVAPQTPADLLPGTLDLLVLRTLVRGANHGYGIAQRVRELSKDVFQIGESSLYPALQRLTLDGYVKAEWGVSENNRRARYYTLTAAGRKCLAAEREEFERVVTAIRMVLDFA
jgi:PadR family transcriptional regulator, regulatory protein PadR